MSARRHAAAPECTGTAYGCMLAASSGAPGPLAASQLILSSCRRSCNEPPGRARHTPSWALLWLRGQGVGSGLRAVFGSDLRGEPEEVALVATQLRGAHGPHQLQRRCVSAQVHAPGRPAGRQRLPEQTR